MKKFSIYDSYRDLAEIRIYQGKQGNLQRYISKAQQWLRRAKFLAIKLDRQVGSTAKQDKIERMQAEIKNLGETKSENIR